MSKLLFMLAFLGISIFLPQDQKLKKVKVTDKISVSLPVDFVPMTFEDMTKKSITSQPPTAMFTNSERIVDFGVNVTKNKWPDDNLDLMKEFYRVTIQNSFNEVAFSKEAIEEINGRRFLVFEFISTIHPEKEAFNKTPLTTYTYLMYAVVDKNIIVFNFSCPAKIRTSWTETAFEIMQTVKIK